MKSHWRLFQLCHAAHLLEKAGQFDVEQRQAHGSPLCLPRSMGRWVLAQEFCDALAAIWKPLAALALSG